MIRDILKASDCAREIAKTEQGDAIAFLAL
jgi:hypothetical protein